MRRRWLSLRKAQSVYDALIAVADPAAPADAPETFCRRLLARLQAMLGAEDADAWQTFVVWAQQAMKPPRLLHVLAAIGAALEEDWPRAFRHAKTAVAMSQRDLFAQRLYLRARGRIEGAAATVAEDLSDFFCPHPFESFEFRPNGDVHTCCPAWLPVPIGNFHRQSPRKSGTRRPPGRSAARFSMAPTGIARGCTARRSSTAACHVAPI